MPYSDRIKYLVETLSSSSAPIIFIPTAIVYSYDEALKHYQQLVELGYEGTILKKPEGIWKDGTSKEQCKMKVECCVELEMVELNEGKGKNKELFGSVLCRSSDGEFEVNISGFKDDERKELYDNWNTYQGKIVSVMLNNIMKPTDNNPKYSAFLPRFVEHREDKDTADSLQRIIEQFEAIVKPK